MLGVLQLVAPEASDAFPPGRRDSLVFLADPVAALSLLTGEDPP